MTPKEPLPIHEKLRLHGYRITHPRKAVIRVLDEAESWLRPEEIHARALTFHPSLGLVTVYRTLALLGDLGLSRRIHLDDGCHGFIQTTMGHSHHLICRVCQQTVEVPGSEAIEPYIDHLSRETGFHIDEHVLELLGLCPDCGPAKEASSR